VKYVDEFIVAMRPVAPEQLDEMSSVLGCLFGECVIAAYGGEWSDEDGEWSVDFAPGHGLYPMHFTRKWLLGEPGNSLLDMYDEVPLYFEEHLRGEPGDKGEGTGDRGQGTAG
jgi:hypothetical protein